ncbi:hypothetical protein THRCLA_21005 [Thraustotheca clavata]|uniref:Uncharacterized protein n=1 Tax=Thraustotheca clavata TaxID=74557 RepID=A0A1W0A1D1_9STRA|nr:hypothetical protein THRCLA_21005 [Thraustotheca clavata]
MEEDILDAIPSERMALDCPPLFLKQILPPFHYAQLWSQMRFNYGYLQVVINPQEKLKLDMSSAALCRLFKPSSTKKAESINLCKNFHRDLLAAFIDPNSRHIVFIFNSKTKARKWNGHVIPVNGVLTTLVPYLRPDEQSIDKSATKSLYSFKLLNLGVDVKSIDTSPNNGTDKINLNSYYNDGNPPTTVVNVTAL